MAHPHETQTHNPNPNPNPNPSPKSNLVGDGALRSGVAPCWLRVGTGSHRVDLHGGREELRGLLLLARWQEWLVILPRGWQWLVILPRG